MKLKRLPKRSSTDRISSLPENIIETILCLVPIRDAVRTSILSRKWRYSWARIPKLVFNEKDMFDESKDRHQEEVEEEEGFTERKELTRRCKLFCAIHQVLLMHRGVILEFIISMNSDNKCVEIDQIITYLSMKDTVKKFTLELNGYNNPYKLPLSVFSLHQLTDLHLQQCDLRNHQPTVNGFGRLTSLFLDNVDVTEKLILHLVSKSPLLKSFSLVTLSFSPNSIYELLGFLPAIEHLYLAIQFFCLFFAYESPLRELPTPLVHLKYAYLFNSFFIGKFGLPFAVFLIRSSPNLEKLKLQCFSLCDEKSEIDSLAVEEYSDIWLEHLKELKLDLAHQIPELEFVKLILAKSPVLKTFTIHTNYRIDRDAELEMLRVLTRTPRASQNVKLTVERISDDQTEVEVRYIRPRNVSGF